MNATLAAYRVGRPWAWHLGIIMESWHTIITSGLFKRIDSCEAYVCCLHRKLLSMNKQIDIGAQTTRDVDRCWWCSWQRNFTGINPSKSFAVADISKCIAMHSIRNLSQPHTHLTPLSPINNMWPKIQGEPKTGLFFWKFVTRMDMVNVASTGIFTILALIINLKMNVIANISCYFLRSVVTLKLRKEYLNIVIYNTPVLLWIKIWTV